MRLDTDSIPMLCTTCGWQTAFNKFVLEYFNVTDSACPACKSSTSWKKLSKASSEEKENMLWKRLLFVEHKTKFSEGSRFNLGKAEVYVQELLNDALWVKANPRMAKDLWRMRGKIDMEFVDDYLKRNGVVE